MPGLPVVYRKSAEGAIASYDWLDISEETGIKTFSCGTNSKVSTSSGANAQSITYSGATLFQNTFYSKDPETSRFEAGTENNIFLTMNFDLAEFNKPKIMKGTAYFEGPIYNQSGTSSAFWNIVKLQKISTVEGVDTIEDISSDISGATVSQGNFIVDFIPIPISGAVHFASGDKLRLYAQARYLSGVTNRRIVIGHDPFDRDGTYIKPSTSGALSTVMRLHVPFKLDL